MGAEDEIRGYLVLIEALLVILIGGFILRGVFHTEEDKAQHLRWAIEDAGKIYYSHMKRLGYSEKDAHSLLVKEFGWSIDPKQNLRTLKSLNKKLRKIPNNGE